MIENGNGFNYVEIIRHALIAFFAGVAHALNEKTYLAKKSGWSQVGEFVASALVASFAGVVFGLLSIEYFGEGSYIALAVTGAGGFMGAKGLRAITNSLVNIVKISLEKETIEKK